MSTLATFDLSPVGPRSLPEPRRIVLPANGAPEPGRIYQAPVFSTDVAADMYRGCTIRMGDCTKWVPVMERFARENEEALQGLSPDALADALNNHLETH